MNEILAVFRVIAPELIWVQDDQVKAMIALYEGFVSKKTFGTKYNLAVAYVTAHMISLNNVYTATAGASADASVAGVKREREGDLEREYAIPDASDYMSLLYKTYYGRMYLQIMKLCSIGIKTRFG